MSLLKIIFQEWERLAVVEPQGNNYELRATVIHNYSHSSLLKRLIYKLDDAI